LSPKWLLRCEQYKFAACISVYSYNVTYDDDDDDDNDIWSQDVT